MWDKTQMETHCTENSREISRDLLFVSGRCNQKYIFAYYYSINLHRREKMLYTVLPRCIAPRL